MNPLEPPPSAPARPVPPQAPPASPGEPATASGDVKTIIRQQAHDTTVALKEGAEEALDTVKETASSLLGEQKHKVADMLENYRMALVAAGDRLSEDAANPLIRPARQAAGQLEKASAYLRDKSGQDVIQDLSRLARSKPEWVFGGLFVAGLAAARFLKASAPRNPSVRRSLPALAATAVSRPMPAAAVPGVPPSTLAIDTP